ncbi:MAG: hypothetical protein NZ845_05100 [Thermodesulfovibrio sp.]|nr:hypothetical protein [Thermodesulfovibrio sp.]MCX7724501.1 hypothetical protein [Thermodesulfovibrio sp.]MDW7971695.1 hypothetical protein [Thermodesulfovibrio sp.]
MAAEEKIDPLVPYRGVRPIKEGSVFAKYKIRKKIKKSKETEKETPSPNKKSQEQIIDIEA